MMPDGEHADVAAMLTIFFSTGLNAQLITPCS